MDFRGKRINKRQTVFKIEDINSPFKDHYLIGFKKYMYFLRKLFLYRI